MIRKIFFSCLLITSIMYADSHKDERMFWDEVKDSHDIEMLKLYQKQYPHGVFKPIADIKIKRLREQQEPQSDENSIPLWVHNKNNVDYRYYGIGFANKHYEGKHYQENLARSRAKQEIMKKFDKAHLSNKTMDDYLDLLKTEKYMDDRGRIYILLYLDNYDLK